ncbi:hypothetical protein DUI87_01551 [Hirundo rustica rustica]|uniref:Uncharacterized protein n=1 Tax=Hirundo rustica rustica TaxID=333673 RepID=A0A3M0L5B4_HIRRU|nr:hypothetical protein DUI87_01551 [Hirundo rustica rustica]
MLCQWYVARALSGVRKQFPDAHVYHYMDDILVATPTQEELLRLQPQLLNALHSHGLQVAPEKVQQQPPWKYLGVKILERTIRHQEVQFVQSVKTLNDAQKLVGVITWLRPYLGLTTAQLSPLFELLKGDTDLKSPRELTPEARKVLEEVQQAVSACQVYRIEPSIDVTVFITTPDLHPTGIIGQWNDDWTDPLHVLEWVFLPHQPHKTVTALFELIARLIIKCRQRCLQLMGADPSKIILPVHREEFDWSYANNVSLQSALEGFSGQTIYHLPSHKLLQVAKNTQFSLQPKNSQEPVQGSTVFTDGSGKTGKAIVTWQDGSEWQVLEGHEDGSAQLVELKAAVMAFEKFSQEPFNLIMDSAYVADIAQRLGCSVLKEVSNPALFHLLKALWCAIQARVHPYYILHVRSHTNLPGFVAEGNARADKLANPAWVAPQPDVLAQAKASHGFFHQNAHTLQKQFQLMATEAREIVESCDNCHALGAPLPALELWQTDVTQFAEFGRLKYVHVTVDTFSSAMWASAHTGEKARDVIAHWRQAFAVLGIPSAVKTDNGPAYASQQVRQFLQSWGVSHNFGIPHSPTGQAIVERAHGTLKHVLQKQKWGMQGETPHSRLAKALYTINHLTVPQNSNNPVILNHHLSLQALDGEQQPRAKVRVRNLVTKQWEGPYDLIAMGEGMRVCSRTLGHAGYLQSVSVLTCDHRGRIQLTGTVEAVINLKTTKWMNPRVITLMIPPQTIAAKKPPGRQAAPRVGDHMYVDSRPWEPKVEALFAPKGSISGRGATGKFFVSTLEFVFVIKKANKGKWRLLHNLRLINNVIEDMGSLQPGMPSPAMLPQNWNLAIIDIKDRFFQIPLHPDDAPHFAFSVPTLNREAPRKRYHWKFLPQGMKNSPSICQWYLSSLLSPVRAAVGEAIILHYMDDVLVCARNDDLLSHVLNLTIDSLVAAGFELQEEKIQRMLPWKYLGLEIGKRTIVMQKLVVKNNIRTLADVQQLCGSLNWWEKVEKSKKDKDCRDPLLIIEWVFLSHHWSKRMTRPQELVAELIRKARTRIRELAGCDFECIHIPIEINSGQITKAMLEHLIHENESLQFALDSYTGQISIHQPAHKLFSKQIQFKLSLKSVQSRIPLKALIIFTDASGASHKSVITWKDPQTQQWEKDTVEVEGSPQVAELPTVVRVFEKFPEPFNLITDSAYVAGVVSRAEQAVLSEVSNAALFNLLSKLVNLISHREQQFYVMHIRSHTDLPGFIAEGNRRADALAVPVEMAPLPDIFGQAKISHQLFHQNAPGLVHQFHLTREQARAIVAMCPSCQQHALPALSAGANPRGLNSCEVWHTDVTHVMSFGRQRENCQLQLKAKPPVMVKDPATGETEGPHDLVTWGRGYTCVSTPSGPKWVPAKWVKPFIPKSAKPPAEAPQVASSAWRRRKHRTFSL